MPGIDRIRPSDDQPDQPAAEAARPSWSDRWRAAQAARMEEAENDLRELLADLGDTDDGPAASSTEGKSRSADLDTSVDRNSDRHGPEEDQQPTRSDGPLPSTQHSDRESASQIEGHAEDMNRPRGDDQPSWHRFSDPPEHVPWEQRLADLSGPGKGMEVPGRRAETVDAERVQVERPELHSDSATERRTGEPDSADVARPTSYHATTVGGTDHRTGTDSPGSHTDQTSPSPWWIETGDRPTEPAGDPGSVSPRHPRGPTTVGTKPSGSEHPDVADDAPTSWVSDAFKIPGGTRVGEGWSAFPAGGDSSVGRAADAPRARDDFGPIDGDRWRQVPCAEQRPQRVYELHTSDMPLTEAESDAIVRAKDKIAEVLGEASGRELTADDVQEALQYVNPTGGRINCVECAKAVDDILGGHAAAAGPTEDQPKYYLEAALSPRTVDYVENLTAGAVERLLSDAGAGARGIVIGWTNRGAVHAYNVANIEGETYWLDGQQDTMTEHDPEGFASFDLYRTG